VIIGSSVLGAVPIGAIGVYETPAAGPSSGSAQGTSTTSALIGPANYTWWNSSWTKRVRLHYYNAGRSTLTDFPVKVLLDSSRITYADFKAGGVDIRFVTTGGVTLEHEIVNWNTSGVSVVYFKASSIAASNGEWVYMYYGNTAATDTQNAANVWSNEFEAVWHLNDTSGAFLDATANNHDSNLQVLTSRGTYVDGIGYCAELDGTTGTYITFPDSAGWRIADWTIEAVVKIKGTASATASSGAGGSTAAWPICTRGVAYADSAVADVTWWLAVERMSGHENKVISDFEDSNFASNNNAGIRSGSTLLTINNTTVHHVASRCTPGSGGSHAIFVDGTQANSETLPVFGLSGTQQVGIQPNIAATSTSPVGIGCAARADTQARTGGLNAFIGEVRINTTPRSNDWINATSNTHDDTFLYYAAAETYSSSSIASGSGSAAGTVSVSATIMGTGNVDPATVNASTTTSAANIFGYIRGSSTIAGSTTTSAANIFGYARGSSTINGTSTAAVANFKGTGLCSGSAAGTSTVAANTAIYLVQENFDSSVQPIGWSASGSVSFSATGLSGTYCAQLDGTSGSTSAQAPFTSSASVWAKFKFRVVLSPSSTTQSILRFATSGGSILTDIRIDQSGSLYLGDGGITSDLSLTGFSVGQVYTCWFRLSAGTGYVAFSTNGIRPTTMFSLAAQAGSAGMFSMSADDTAIVEVDDLLISRSEIDPVQAVGKATVGTAQIRGSGILTPAAVAGSAFGEFGRGMHRLCAAHWKLDETSNGSSAVQRNDSHVYGNHLTDTATVASAAGVLNNGADFELSNVGELLTIPDNPPLSLGVDTPFEISFWFKAESFSAANVLVAKGTSATGTSTTEYAVYSSSTTSLRFRISNGVTGATVVLNTTLVVGTTYFVTAYHDPATDTIGLAINNGTPTTAAWSGGTWDSTNAFTLGALSNGTNRHDGIIDEVTFHRRLLTSTERSILFNSGAATAYENWPQTKLVSGSAAGVTTVASATMSGSTISGSAAGTSTAAVANAKALRVGTGSAAGAATAATNIRGLARIRAGLPSLPIPGERLWLRGDFLKFDEDGLVIGWSDLSDSHFPVTGTNVAANSGVDPLIGIPGAEFFVNGYLTATISQPRPFSVMLVWRDGGVNGRTLSGANVSPPGNFLLGGWNNYVAQLHADGWVTDQVTTRGGGNRYTTFAVASTTSTACYNDGNDVTEFPTPTGGWFSSLRLGGTTGELSADTIYELVVYPFELSPVQVAILQDYSTDFRDNVKCEGVATPTANFRTFNPVTASAAGTSTAAANFRTINTMSPVAVSGAATASANILATGLVDPVNVAGVATAAVNIRGTAAVYGITGGVATVHTIGRGTGTISGTAAGVATVSASALGFARGSSTISGVATVTANFNGAGRFSGTAGGVATATAASGSTSAASGSAAGVTTTSAVANFNGTGRATASSAGDATAASAFRTLNPTSGTAAGVTTTSTANIAASGLVDPATTNGVATASANFRTFNRLTPVAVNGVATGAANIRATGLVDPASAAGVATAASTVTGFLRASGSAAGAAAISAVAIRGTGRTSSTVTATATAAANLTTIHRASGTAAGVATPSVTILGFARGSSTVTATATTSANALGFARGSSTISGVATAAVNATAVHTRTVSTTGVATPSANITGTGRTSSTQTATATASANIRGTGLVSGSAAGSAVVQSGSGGTSLASGSAAGVASATSAIRGTGRTVGSAAAAATVAANLRTFNPVTASAAGAATVAANIRATGLVDPANVSGSATVASNILATGLVDPVNAAGVATVGMAQIMGTGNVDPATTTGTATTSVSNFQGTGRFSGTATAVATVAAGTGGTILGSGTSSAAATASAVIMGTGRVSATRTASATASANLRTFNPVTASAAGAATAASAFRTFNPVTGSAAGSAVASSTTGGTVGTSGSAAGSATVSAALRGTARGSSTVNGVATTSATLRATSVASGTAAGVATVGTAQIMGTGRVSATRTASATVSANIRGTGLLSGTAAGSSTTSTTSSSYQNGSGTAAGVATVSAIGRAFARFSGTVAGVASVPTAPIRGIARRVVSVSGTSSITTVQIRGTARPTTVATTGTASAVVFNFRTFVSTTGSAVGAATGASGIRGIGRVTGISAAAAAAFSGSGGTSVAFGTANGTATVTANIKGFAARTVSTGGTTAATATIRGFFRTTGTAAGVSTPVVNIRGLFRTVGSAAGNVSTAQTTLLGLARTVATATAPATGTAIVRGFARPIATSNGVAIITVNVQAIHRRTVSTGGTSTALLTNPKGTARAVLTSAGTTASAAIIRGTATRAGSSSATSTAAAAFTGLRHGVITIVASATASTAIRGVFRTTGTVSGTSSLSSGLSGTASGVYTAVGVSVNSANIRATGTTTGSTTGSTTALCLLLGHLTHGVVAGAATTTCTLRPYTEKRNFPTNVMRHIVETRTFYVDVDLLDAGDPVLIGVYGMRELDKLTEWINRPRPARMFADVGSAQAALNGRHQMDAYTNMTELTKDDVRTLRNIFIETWGPVNKVEYRV
jgi:hypothetical protein